MEPSEFHTDPPAWARNVSGLAWAIVFYLLTFILWQLLGWALLGVVEDRLLLAAMPLLAANLITNFALPRPDGIGPWEGLGFSGHDFKRPLFGGIGLTAASGIAVLLALYAMGEIGLANSGEGIVLYAAPMLAAAAFGEELFFRGYGFQQLGRAITPTGAALFTGMAFGFVHHSNPEVSEVAVANTVLFGILFGLGWVWSRSFWLPYGLHVGWNFALAALGAPVSGLKIKGTSLETVPAGSSLWDGGAYGPEGGLAATLVVLMLLRVAWKLRGLNQSGRLIWDDARPEKGG